MQSAGVTLVKGDLRGIAKAIRLSRYHAEHSRKSVLCFSLQRSRNSCGGRVLYLFFGLLLSPIIAGAAMSLSSVSVIGTPLRLRKTRL
jgi:Cu+-exporting ATPase